MCMWCISLVLDVVKSHRCVDSDSEVSLDEQHTTVDNYSIAGLSEGFSAGVVMRKVGFSDSSV